MNRTLYLIDYDITDGNRLNNTRRLLKGYSTGGQKSVFECFLTQSELHQVTSALEEIIDDKEDRVHIFTMDGRSKTHTLGIGVQPTDPEFFYIG
jgi:CRISPR-associated protein Cas2